MARGILAHVQPGQEQAEGGGAAQGIEQGAIGDHAHAAIVQRAVTELQWFKQLAVVLQHLAAGFFAGMDGPLGPGTGGTQAFAQLLEQRAVGLGKLAHFGAQFFAGLLHGQIGSQAVHVAQVEIGGHPARQQQDLAGDGGGDIGIAVAVAAHPGGEANRRGLQRQPFTEGFLQGAIDVAQEVRQRVPEGMLDHREAPFRLVHRGRPGAADFVGVPGLGDQPLEFFLHRLALFGQQVAVVTSGQLAGDGVVLLNQRAARHFGGVRGEHQLDLQLRHLPRQAFRPQAGLFQTAQQFGQDAVLEGLRLLRRAAANAVVLLGDVGQVEKLVEGARHRQQFVLAQAVEGGGELLGAFSRAAPGALAPVRISSILSRKPCPYWARMVCPSSSPSR